MALFDPDRHTLLTRTAWSEDRARSALEGLIADVHAAYAGAEGLWPIHPLDISDERPEVLTPLYYGAAGVIWALHHLEARGFPAVGRDYRPAVATLAARGREDALRLHGETRAGFMAGDTGVLMLQHALAPSEGLADDLEAVIASSFDHPAPGFS